jgi:hypothetical protein
MANQYFHVKDAFHKKVSRRSGDTAALLSSAPVESPRLQSLSSSSHQCEILYRRPKTQCPARPTAEENAM